MSRSREPQLWATRDGSLSRFDAANLRQAKAALEGDLAGLPETGFEAALRQSYADQGDWGAPSSAAAYAPRNSSGESSREADARALRRAAGGASAAPDEGGSAPRARSSLMGGSGSGGGTRADEPATAPRRASIATAGGSLYERGLIARERLERERQRVIEETRRAANPQLNPTSLRMAASLSTERLAALYVRGANRQRSSSLPGGGGSVTYPSGLAQSQLIDVTSPVPVGQFYVRSPPVPMTARGGGGGGSFAGSVTGRSVGASSTGGSAPTFYEDGRITRPAYFHLNSDPEADPEATFSPRITARSARLAAKVTGGVPAPERLYRAAVQQHRRHEAAVAAAPAIEMAGCTFFPSTDKSSVEVLRQQAAHVPGAKLVPAEAAVAAATPPGIHRAPPFSARILKSSSPASAASPLQASPLATQRSAAGTGSSVGGGGAGDGSVAASSPRGGGGGSKHLQSAVIVLPTPRSAQGDGSITDRPDLVRRVVPAAASREMHERHLKWIAARQQHKEEIRRAVIEAELADCSFTPRFESGSAGPSLSRRASLPSARDLSATGGGSVAGRGSASRRSSLGAPAGSRANVLVLPRVPGDIEAFADRQDLGRKLNWQRAHPDILDGSGWTGTPTRPVEFKLRSGSRERPVVHALRRPVSSAADAAFQDSPRSTARGGAAPGSEAALSPRGSIYGSPRGSKGGGGSLGQRPTSPRPEPMAGGNGTGSRDCTGLGLYYDGRARAKPAASPAVTTRYPTSPASSPAAASPRRAALAAAAGDGAGSSSPRSAAGSSYAFSDRQQQVLQRTGAAGAAAGARFVPPPLWHQRGDGSGVAASSSPFASGTPPRHSGGGLEEAVHADSVRARLQQLEQLALSPKTSGGGGSSWTVRSPGATVAGLPPASPPPGMSFHSGGRAGGKASPLRAELLQQRERALAEMQARAMEAEQARLGSPLQGWLHEATRAHAVAGR